MRVPWRFLEEAKNQKELGRQADQNFRRIEQNFIDHEPWQSPSFQNGWQSRAPWYVAYRRNSAGDIQIRGVMENGPGGVAAFTLPASYRPSQRLFFGTTFINSGSPPQVTYVYIDTNGDVVPADGTGFVFMLDGISFSAVA